MADLLFIPHLSLELPSASFSDHSSLVASLLSQSPASTPVLLDLPAFVSKPLIDLYLACTAGGDLQRIETTTATDLTRLSIVLQDSQLEEALMRSSPLTTFSPENIIAVYALAAEHRDRSQTWAEYFSRALLYAKGNVSYILERCSPMLTQISKESLEWLLLESLKTDFGRQVSDMSPVVRSLKGLWGCANLADMLEKAEARAKATPLTTVSLQWTFDWTPGMRVLTSPEFEVEGLTWQLHTWFDEAKDRVDVYLASGMGERQHISGVLVAASVVVSLFPEECFREAKVVTLLLGSKGQKLIKSVYGVKARHISPSVSVTAQVRLEHTYSALLTYVAVHFEDPLVCEKAGKLSGERIQQLLAMKQLNVSSEDSVLRLIGQWSERHRKMEDLELQLGSLLSGLRWGTVSTRGLIDCCRLYPSLKTNSVFRSAVKREFEFRSNVRDRREDGSQPRLGHSNQPHHDTTFSVFVSDLCSVITGLDYTVDPWETELQAANDLTVVLRDREKEARRLRESLHTFKSLFSSRDPTPALSLANTQAVDVKKQLEECPRGAYRTNSDSTAAGKSNKPPSPLDNSAEGLDVKVNSLLTSFLTKVEAKRTSGSEELL